PPLGPRAGRALVQEALALSAERPITSVLQRSQEFVAAADRWHDLPAVAEVAEAVCQATRPRPSTSAVMVGMERDRRDDGQRTGA
ncbi:MAG TPA: hypothetical protein VKP11_10730, partial [Frankiaceae bacterium]|nr:hypothetical protein [Frankiaceae bacterium]